MWLVKILQGFVMKSAKKQLTKSGAADKAVDAAELMAEKIDLPGDIDDKLIDQARDMLKDT